MKCSNPSCEWIGSGKFCSQCGTPTAFDPRVVPCTGRHKDGNICQAQLHASQQFCNDCGTKVDPCLFTRPPVTQHPSDLSSPVDSPSEDIDARVDETQLPDSVQLEKTSDLNTKVIIPPTLTQVLDNLKNFGETSGCAIEGEKELKKASDEKLGSIRHNEPTGVSEEKNDGVCKNSEVASFEDMKAEKHVMDALSKKLEVQEGCQKDSILNNSFDSEPDSDGNTSAVFVKNSKSKKRKKKNKKRRKREREAKAQSITSFQDGNEDTETEKNTPESLKNAGIAKYLRDDSCMTKTDPDLSPGNTIRNSNEREREAKTQSITSFQDGNEDTETDRKTPESLKNVGIAKDLRDDSCMIKSDSVLSPGNTIRNSNEREREAKTQSITSFQDGNEDTETDRKTPESLKNAGIAKDLRDVSCITKTDSDLSPGNTIRKSNEVCNSETHSSKETCTVKETDVDTMETTTLCFMKENNSPGHSNANNVNDDLDDKMTEKQSESSLTTEKMITVRFHALVSKDFSFNTDKDKLFIQTDMPEDHWTSHERICVRKGFDSDMPEMVFEMDVPASRITGDKKVQYRYCIEKEREKGTTYESYVLNKNTGKGTNRTLHIINRWKDTDVWDQYDGVIEKENWIKDLAPNLLGWKKKERRKKAVHALKLVFKAIVHRTDISFRDQFEQAEVLLHCFKKIYFHDGGIWNDVKECEKAFGKHMIKTLLEFLSKCQSGPKESKEEIERRISTSLLILLIKRKTHISVSKDEHTTRICQALLLRPDPERKSCAEIQFVLSHFSRETMTDMINEYVKEMATSSKNPAWLYLMPWLHFLRDECLPYQEPHFDIEHDSEIPFWWGIPYMEKEVETFKQNYGTWFISATDVLKNLSPLFEMDHLLQRTFLTAVELKDLKVILGSKLFSIEVMLANLVYHLRRTGPKSSDFHSSYINVHENNAVSCVLLVAEQLQETSEGHGTNPDCFLMAVHFAFDLLKEAVIANQRQKFIICVQTLIHCLALFEQSVKKEKACMSKLHEKTQYIEESVKMVYNWINRYCSNNVVYMGANIDQWKNVFAQVHVQSGHIRDVWNEHMSVFLDCYLENKVLQSSPDLTQYFICYYCEKSDTCCPPMQECLTKAAFKAIERGYNVNIGGLMENQKKKLGKLLSVFFTREWQKDVKEGDPKEHILFHALSWTPLETFLSKCHRDAMLFSEECQQNIDMTKTIIADTIEELFSGKITVKTIGYLKRFESKFTDLAILIDENRWKRRNIQKAIQIREKEILTFKEHAKYIASLLQLCQKLEIEDKAVLKQLLLQQENFEDCKLEDLCFPVEIGEVNTLQGFHPCITIFDDIPFDIYNDLTSMHNYNKSNIFHAMWQQECSEKIKECKILSEVHESIWKPVKERLQTLIYRIEKGTIKFSELEDYFGKGRDETYIRSEMENLQITETTISHRLNQLTQFRKLEMCVKGAKTIFEFKESFELSGNFDPVLKITEQENMDMDMVDFNVEYMEAFHLLMGLTEKQADCIAVFIRCKELVTWLKETMRSGVKELKVFLDLAFMTAGDEPLKVLRVRWFHSAVTGYAPLIFELKQDADFNQLLKVCNVVWKELDANEKLPDRLRNTQLQLDWFKNVQAAHGSVEVTSLNQAHAINSTGIFVVGSCEKKRSKQSITLELDSVLCLTAVIGSQRERKVYTIKELQDLQSRLMLVAGKSELESNSVKRFTEVFDSVLRLSKVFIKLCTAGCVFFKDWTAKFLCNEKLRICTILEFGTDKDIQSLQYRCGKDADLQDIIKNLANFMEVCYDDWLDHIAVKRNNNKYLNYFTNDQLVILQKELVKFGTQNAPSKVIYQLLSAVRQTCTEYHLEEAMTAAKARIRDSELKEEQTNQHSEVENKNDFTNIDKMKNDVEKHFIQELVKFGYTERNAIKALQYVAPEKIDEGVCWCIEHADDDSDDDEEEPVGAQRESLFSKWSESDVTIQQMIVGSISSLNRNTKDKGYKPMLRDLEKIWRHFLDSLSSSINDYLSLDHLGIILQCLNKESQSIARSFPDGLYANEPNLIVCPSGDVLASTLCIYMFSKDQALPQADEILLCTPKTTLNEIDIFWRRAIFDSNGKIHCLVNADILEFDVSERAEECLHDYIKRTNEKDSDFRIVVICGSDKENQSRMIVSFNKYQRQNMLVNLHMTELRKYIARKLRVFPDESKEMSPAAIVDRDNSSVRLIKSWRAGVGKTLYKTRLEETLQRLNQGHQTVENITIPLQEKNLDVNCVINTLLEQLNRPGQVCPRIIHFDLAREVEYGVDYLLFNLLILGCLIDKTGYVWRKSPMDLYLIETMPLVINTNQGEEETYVHQILNILPEIACRSPRESLMIYRMSQVSDGDQLFDDGNFKSETFQRPFQYLQRLDQNRTLIDVNAKNIEGTKQMCLETLLRHCGIEDPSWAELHHFVSFLNTQLCDFEKNDFVCTAANTDLPGFSAFVIQFLIQMSRDFSTRSLDLHKDSPCLPTNRIDSENERDDEDLQQYQLRRTWEKSPHPYLFFNADRTGFTFLGFFIDRASGDVIDQQTGVILQRGIMAKNLYDALVRNHIPLQENFDALSRGKKLEKLCNVMGNDMPYDPDDTYELTTDNAKKIMAIYMRFRCDIPVIIMGETGCGKTRLIKFMCALQKPPGVEVQNMLLMKVHGGTSNADIISKVREAEAIAKKNSDEYCSNGRNMYTVLFFDEANATESIGLIKEIMCDKSISGKKINLCANLKIVAACNPYRKHSEELIRKFEQAGLGYHVDAEDTMDKLGRVPMRRLVYRVQPLPQSLLPLIWDFGQLNTQVEELYIRQMVKRYQNSGKLPQQPGIVGVISQILTSSQDYMRTQKDECSFVSLRDVERALDVMSWFYSESQNGSRILFKEMDTYHIRNRLQSPTASEQESEEQDYEFRNVDDITRSLVLSLGVCYYASLGAKDQYRKEIAKCFQDPCNLPGGDQQFLDEITACQEAFLNNVELTGNIAKNTALKENIFMMVVCIELRIPLFLVGKPGSSKSLAKIIVSDAMQGSAAGRPDEANLFKELKQVQMLSYQCSPLSTPDGIIGTFRQCAHFQQDKDLDKFVSVVVLDEVGLAEESQRMPLKTLHALLEDGWQGDENIEDMPQEVDKKYRKVAFIGISNWALDPAKMNRGIYVQRGIPDLDELQESVRGICAGTLQNRMEPMITPLANSYLDILKQAAENKREFFGLRDFYSLVKMVNSFMVRSNQNPTWHEMVHAIKRNFDGLDNVCPLECFKKNVSDIFFFEDEPQETDPDCSTAGLIQSCLFERGNQEGESRYLLLLTENYGALSILQQQILSHHADIRPITIFGSSFRCDQEYTQVCRNINKIKVCMETGNTVVLLNLENLYESLYDALNQYYVYFGGERFVDLGLGTHRVKCLVHNKFRLIVVAEKQTVYKKFPTPLINRLEKHFLTTNLLLTDHQITLSGLLENWARKFVTLNNVKRRQRQNHQTIEGTFIGYNDDTCPSIILHVWNKIPHQTFEGCEEIRVEAILCEAKKVLLWCATPSSIVWMDESCLPDEEKQNLEFIYNNEQKHKNILEYLQYKIVEEHCERFFAQVTTHSNMLTANQMWEIATVTSIPRANIKFFETLTSFDTEQQFSNRVNYHLKDMTTDASLLIIQCDSGDKNANLIASARYCVMDELEKARDELEAPVHVVFIIQLPQIDGGCFTGFQCGMWQSVHIDELYNLNDGLPDIQVISKKTPAGLINDAVRSALDKQKQMETQERYSAVHSKIPCAQSVSSVQEKETVNMEKLIRSCIQSALAMIKDGEDNIARSTNRVSLLLNLLTTASEKDLFLQGISILIAKLLKEKEKDSGSHYAESMYWVGTEAAKNENLNKAGTFRRSCQKVLEGKVAPIFAAVIAFLDINQNLNILKDNLFKWKKRLWFRIFNTDEALPIKCLKSLTQSRDLGEVAVQCTGVNGHCFQAVMPFSWLIHDSVNEILEVPKQDEMDFTTVFERQVRVLRDSKIGKILDEFVEEHETITFLTEYIKDFVQFKYMAHSEEEYRIVCQSILKMAIHRGERDSKTHFLELLICVHISYESFSTQLSNFHTINDVWPECSKTFLAVKDKTPNHFLFTETDCCISGLYLLVEDLAPEENSLTSSATLTAWLQKVYKYRNVVENVLSHHSENEIRFGALNMSAVKKTRGLWCRVLVVKMFIEHVCMTDKDDTTFIKHCMPLWKLLGDEADLKEMKSLALIEKFLRSCNKGFIKSRGLGAKCSTCGKILDGPPVQLPCNDVVCETCHCEISLGDKICKMCELNTSPEKKADCGVQDRENLEKLKIYQRSCNTFFMDVVTQLCFSGMTPPSHDVIDRLMSYITLRTDTFKGTKQMSVFETGIDPSPVFRSFLLQLIMRSSETKVTEMIDAYIKGAVNIPRDMQYQELQTDFQLSLLVIQCFEDNLWRNSMETEEIQISRQSLRHARQVIDSKEFRVEKMRCLAETRMGLAVAAKYIMILAKQSSVSSSARNLLEEAQCLCVDSKCVWPRKYLVKYICRRFGVEAYRTVCRSEIRHLHWVIMYDLDMSKMECPDRYVVLGDSYKRIREAVTKVILGEDATRLTDTLQGLREPEGHKDVMLQLAVHREITLKNIHPIEKKDFSGKVQHELERICDVKNSKDKEFLQKMLNNHLGGHLTIAEGEDLNRQSLQCLLLHYLCTVKGLKENSQLMQPMFNLIAEPQTLKWAYLPTMPQDDLEDIKKAMLEASQRDADENPAFYRCPNGHVYVVGDCGRPYVVGKCKCGAEIGGRSHNLLQTNAKDDSTDQTKPGHVLGRVKQMGKNEGSIRSLSPVFCATLRLLTHMAMYLGTLDHRHAMVVLFTPEIDEDEVEDFLWDHIQQNLDDLSEALGRSIDDVMLIVHSVIARIMTHHDSVEEYPDEMIFLTTKKGRNEWEERFSMVYLQPVFQILEEHLELCNKELVQDERLGSDPLMCMLYETEGHLPLESISTLQDVPAVWTYRSPVSLIHVKQEFERMTGGQHQYVYSVLQLFLQEEHYLKVLRCIPGILRLQQILIDRYRRKLDKTQASSITVGQLVQDHHYGCKIKHMVDDFVYAWTTVRGDLKEYLCPTAQGGEVVPDEFSTKEISDDTPITVLLPTTNGAGLCSYVLLDFLMRKQNDFLDKYLKGSGRKLDSQSVVQPKKITSAHLISFDTERDLMPLVLANCQYSFEVGKGTRIEYDFANLERQIIDRFLFSKSRIEVGRYLNINTMVYKTEFTNASVFMELAEKIPQVSLTSAVKRQICNEIRSMPDLCRSVDNLDITISFLKSVGGDPRCLLSKFMEETLLMETSFSSERAIQVCQFQHAKSLWLLFSLQRSKLMADNNHQSQAIFETLVDIYHEKMSDSDIEKYEGYLKTLLADQLARLTELLHEYILLELPQMENTDNVEINSLGEWLSAYVEGMDEPLVESRVLLNFPEDIYQMHSVYAWLLAYKALKIKDSERL